MTNLSVKERILALQQQQRPSTSLGVMDAQRRISSGSKNVKERATAFQHSDHSSSNPSSPTGSSLSQFTSNTDKDLITPPSTNPPSSPRLPNIQTPPSSVRVENGSVSSSSALTDLVQPSSTPTPSSPAFTATTDDQVPELVETDLQHNQAIVQLLRNDKQLSYQDEDRVESPPLDVLEATQDLANLSTSFSTTPPAPIRTSIYDDIDDENDSQGEEAGWVTVIN